MAENEVKHLPRYLPKTAERKARSLVKTLTRHKCNESATARELGVTPQAINQRLLQQPVKDELEKALNLKELADKAYKTLESGLNSPKNSDKHTAASALLKYTVGEKTTLNADIVTQENKQLLSRYSVVPISDAKN